MKSARRREPAGPPTRLAAYDAIIVGGGPAGISAALILGRCRRRVLLCDAGRARNAASRALHGFLTRGAFAMNLAMQKDEVGVG